MIFSPGKTYFLLGYLDQECRIPFVQTLVHLKSERMLREPTQEHLFADAIAWYERGAKVEVDVDPSDLLTVADADIDTIKDLAGLLQELSQLG